MIKLNNLGPSRAKNRLFSVQVDLPNLSEFQRGIKWSKNLNLCHSSQNKIFIFTDMPFSWYSYWDTGKFGARWFVLSTGLLSTVRKPYAEYDNSVAWCWRWDSIFKCVGRHKVWILAVLYECVASKFVGVDRLNNNWYVLKTFWAHINWKTCFFYIL